MSDGETLETDAVMTAAMGFSSFGGTKRRKLYQNDVYIDPQIPQTEKGIKENKGVIGEIDGKNAGDGQSKDDANTGQVSGTPGMARNQIDDHQARLKALEKGIRDENGDQAYFLPSFIEDPWQHFGDK